MEEGTAAEMVVVMAKRRRRCRAGHHEEQADEPESQTNMTGAFGAELGQFQL